MQLQLDDKTIDDIMYLCVHSYWGYNKSLNFLMISFGLHTYHGMNISVRANDLLGSRIRTDTLHTIQVKTLLLPEEENKYKT
jgi:hypothetical protein